MKLVLYSGLLLLGASAACAQAPTWQTALSLGGGSYSNVSAVATDAAGNVYLAGWFSNSSLVLGSLTLTNAVTSGSNVGFSKDAFVAKWSPVTRSFVWALRAGGTTDNDNASTLTVSDGSVYVATTLTSAPAGLGGGPAATGNYLTKLTSAGTLVWTQPVGGPAAALVASGSNLYAAGTFAGAASFGSSTFSSLGSNDTYVTKLVDAGATSSYAWTRRVGSAMVGTAGALAVSGSSVYVAGTHYATTAAGSWPLTGNGAFVAKLADAGPAADFTWVQPISWAAAAPADTGAGWLALAASGSNVYLAGAFSGLVSFGATSLTSLGYRDLVVARLADAGPTASFSWVRQLGSPGATSRALAVAVQGSSVYVAGDANKALSFGATGSSSNPGGVLVAKLTDASTTSQPVWLQQATANYTVACNTLALSGSTLYVGGIIGAGSTFGSVPFPTTGGPAAFVASLTDEVTLAATAPAALADLALYPNPAQNTTTVRLPAGAGSNAATLTLYDALGRPVRTSTAPTGQEHAVDLSGLAPGVYALRVRVGEEAATRQLVVE